MKTMPQPLSRRLCGPARSFGKPPVRHAARRLSRQKAAATFVVSGDVEVSSQESLLHIAGCTEIVGDLVIKGPDVTNLEGLDELVRIHGDLVIEKTFLERLAGFSRLATVGGDLWVGDNPLLRSMGGFEELTQVGRSVFIWANERLEDLDGLGGLRSIPEHLEIWGNRCLTSLVGLAGLEVVGKDLSIGRQGFGNDRLRHLDDIGSLRAVGGDLSICFNGSLERMDGLDRVQVKGRVVLERNERLVGQEPLRVDSALKMPEPWLWSLSSPCDVALCLDRPGEFKEDNRPPTR